MLFFQADLKNKWHPLLLLFLVGNLFIDTVSGAFWRELLNQNGDLTWCLKSRGKLYA